MTPGTATNSASDIPREVAQAGSTLGAHPCHCEESETKYRMTTQSMQSSLPWREGVRGRGNFTLTLFLSHQGRGDFLLLRWLEQEQA